MLSVHFFICFSKHYNIFNNKRENHENIYIDQNDICKVFDVQSNLNLLQKVKLS